MIEMVCKFEVAINIIGRKNNDQKYCERCQVE